MTIYLVDYENRGGKGDSNGLAGVENLQATDRVVVFLGPKSPVPQGVLDSCVNASAAVVEFRKCARKGANYLDFQLATMLGALIQSQRDTDFCIVSGDKGFKSVVDFWGAERPGLAIAQRDSIAMPVSVPASTAVPLPATGGTKKTKAASRKEKKAAQPAPDTAPVVPASTAAASVVPAAPAEAHKGKKSAKNASAAEAPAPAATSHATTDSASAVSGRAVSPKPPHEHGSAAAHPAKQTKADPPEAIRKQARNLYKQYNIKIAHIARLYEAMRSSRNREAFKPRLRQILTQEELEASLLPLLALFDAYTKQREGAL